mmetsp:Transcript_35148/g.63246  ORF Transcript_35148/g.63246 Transcript_35148/m.63246 type:complete len:208 (-) Transcript_35148:549-1172(-)
MAGKLDSLTERVGWLHELRESFSKLWPLAGCLEGYFLGSIVLEELAVGASQVKSLLFVEPSGTIADLVRSLRLTVALVVDGTGRAVVDTVCLGLLVFHVLPLSACFNAWDGSDKAQSALSLIWILVLALRLVLCFLLPVAVDGACFDETELDSALLWLLGLIPMLELLFLLPAAMDVIEYASPLLWLLELTSRLGLCFLLPQPPPPM